jgi:hypothetical protein
MNDGGITVGFMPSLNQISAITSKGEIQIDFLKKVCYNKKLDKNELKEMLPNKKEIRGFSFQRKYNL